MSFQSETISRYSSFSFPDEEIKKYPIMQLFSNVLLTSLFVLFSILTIKGQETAIPESYKLLYEQDFSSPTAIYDFEMSDASAWRLDAGEESTLTLFGKSNYKARVRSPFNIALLKNLWVGDFILEVDLSQSGREYGHRDLCLFFSAKDPTNFYYVHMATKADDHANNIFLVNDAPRVKIASKTSDGTNWGATNSWHKVRIERTVADGTIKVFFDDMENPIMEATDTHFDIGRIGFGSFDDTGRFDNIRIWGPQIEKIDKGFFE